MSDTWLKAIVLILIFAAVVFAVERVVGAMIARRSEGRAINQRLELIGRGVSRSDAMQLLKRRSTEVPEGLPAFIAGPAVRLEKTLMAAGVTSDTGKVMLALLVAPVVLFLGILLFMAATGMVIGGGRVLMIGTFALLIGAGIPMLFFQAKATRMRKKMQDQFPVALDVFVRGLGPAIPLRPLSTC